MICKGIHEHFPVGRLLSDCGKTLGTKVPHDQFLKLGMNSTKNTNVNFKYNLLSKKRRVLLI